MIVFGERELNPVLVIDDVVASDLTTVLIDLRPVLAETGNEEIAL
jgi:hypothetical protein